MSCARERECRQSTKQQNLTLSRLSYLTIWISFERSLIVHTQHSGSLCAGPETCQSALCSLHKVSLFPRLVERASKWVSRNGNIFLCCCTSHFNEMNALIATLLVLSRCCFFAKLFHYTFSLADAALRSALEQFFEFPFPHSFKPEPSTERNIKKNFIIVAFCGVAAADEWGPSTCCCCWVENGQKKSLTPHFIHSPRRAALPPRHGLNAEQQLFFLIYEPWKIYFF